ncbi:MAG: transcriptional regulator [Oculatellaceae cyanobacterium Prado106]|jgi:HTH-type transcriptional regulator/antitoxin HigA|nr:transcriptional regulator [Oculatellaceae cyanobacterium Prado106]
MNRAFNPEVYSHLLAQHRPKNITTEAENESALTLAEELEKRGDRTPEEDMLLDLLVILIDKYETEHYPILCGSPSSMLRHFMDAHGLQPTDLNQVLGSLEQTTAIINGERPISRAQGRSLAKFFRVDISLFL